MTDPTSATPEGGSVIHDLGYRPYTGPRLRPAAHRSRPGPHRLPQRLRAGPLREVQGAAVHPARRSTCCPAVIVGGVMVFVGLDELPIGYAQYASTHPGAARHLRGVAGAGALLARPAARHDLALPRPAAAVERPTPSPAGPSLLGGDPGLPAAPDPAPVRRGAARRARRRRADPRGCASRVGLAVLLALSLAGLAGLIASWSTRRGFAVVATIAAAAHRQRHRDGDPGDLARGGARRGSARSPGCSRRTRSTAG